MRGWARLPGVAALGLAIALLGLAAMGGGSPGGNPTPARAATRDDVKVFGNPPATLDPAAEGDIDTAAVTAQLWESLTAFDASLTLRPALAWSWDVSADGRRVVFHLRPGVTFSDGSPITADDVVGSWLRLVDPSAPSPLSALLLDVTGVADRLAGRTTDPNDVGIHAVDGAVEVDLDRPGADLPSIVASPSFGIVPPSIWRDHDQIPMTNQVVSGAYSIGAVTASELTLTANPRYWAGKAPIDTIHLVTDIGGRSPVAAFEAGDVDSIQIDSTDASWIAYDAGLGPQLRAVPELSLVYLGFDTSRPPFNDVQLRQAIGEAVDWPSIVSLAAIGGQVPADSMVPAGIPGRDPTSWLPTHDPSDARSILAQAGYPNGQGFPTVTLAAAGDPYGEGIAAALHQQLGITVRIEDDADQATLLTSDPPAMWEQGWVADYPGQNDFLGVLLGSGSSSNAGRWSSPAFDAAIDAALGTRDPAASQAAFGRALAIVRQDVPVVPLAYGNAWALSRTGLLGDVQNGLGYTRFDGLAWAP